MSYTVQAQIQFEEVLGTPFDGVVFSSIAFADIDGDGDQDVLITGKNANNQNIAKLYTNNGSGGYTEVTGTPFDGVQRGSIAFTDIDGDIDQDVLITGLDESNQRIAKLYTNDGSGGYTEVSGTPFEGVSNGSIAFVDIDGDSDQDVLITGQKANSQDIAKLYTNDGSGGYTEVTGTPFEGVSNGSIAFTDIDGDIDQDLLITGLTNNGPIAKLYTNNGSGGFTELTGTPFDSVWFSSIAFADIDGDIDQDLLITGITINQTIQPIAKLYTNDSSGGYTEVSGTPFEGVSNGSIAFVDIDGDSDQDVLITGVDASNQRITKLYTNDGSGGYTEMMETPFDGVIFSSIAFADIDGDGDHDVLITGENASEYSAKVYRNTSFELNWTGNINNLWTESGNWSTNALPTSTSKVFITDVSNQPMLEVTDQIEINNLVLSNNTTLEVSGVLKVNRDIINSGSITFKSDVTGTGQLDEFTGSYLGSGTVEVERFIPAGKRAFRLISPAITTITSIYANWQENGGSPTNYGTHITGSTTGADGFDQTATGSPSLFTFNNMLEDQTGGAAWEAISNTNVNTLNTGAAYRLLVRGDRNIDLTSDQSSANETVLRASGDLQFGDYSPSISDYDGNFNFVGNPYQAAVDFNQLTFSGDINTNYIYVGDPQQGDLDSFVTIDLLDGSNTVGSNVNEIIQPGQAFFVRNNLTVSTTPSITFTEASKAVDEEQLSAFSVPNYIKLNLQLFASTTEVEEIVDAIGLRFSEDFQNEVNDADAGKMGNTGENLALVNSNQLLSIEQRANPIEGEEIQLFANSYQSENYSFKLQLENTSEDFEVYIKDNYLETQTLINAENDYSFSIDPSITESASIFRFSLVFENVTLSNTEFDQKMYCVYPNPTQDQLFISGIENEVGIEIYNLLGKRVFSIIQKAEESLDISNLETGVYLLKVNDNENSFTQKIIKE
ncbi:hypothetical protein GCM10010832_18110 [Psychroflexus planctonicus]|uniref:Secretion system C-terminal sorting domain-containing protein n=2 Tax=Psychroflexus planctonicus TaxID=1526575 RepID=A0ABQ1SIQ9_9FLAO|nr:hypothetical protein GCM10010832_18110 [Psychroflexus planctonicus]